jgi:hypothetical protein
MASFPPQAVNSRFFQPGPPFCGPISVIPFASNSPSAQVARGCHLQFLTYRVFILLPLFATAEGCLWSLWWGMTQEEHEEQ